MRFPLRGCLLFAWIVAATLTSCQKEISIETPPGGTPGSGGGGNNNNNNIIGDWDYLGLKAHTEVTITFTEAGEELKTVTTSDYVSKNNVGTIKITASEMIGNGIGYSVDTTMHVKTYIDNVLIDEEDFPFAATAPPTSSTSTYTRVNNDSIAVNSAMGVPSTSPGPTPTGPTGMRISWAGDTLLLTANTVFTQSITQTGVPGTYRGVVRVVTRLKRR